MTKQLNIKIAEQNDITEVAKLLQILIQQEAEFTPNIELQEKGIAKIIDNPEIGSIITIIDNDTIVGMVNILFTISTAIGQKAAILEDFVVLPQYRNQGIGKQLFEWTINYAKEFGCKRITLLTDGNNSGAHKFYKSFGFNKSRMVPFRLILG
jgi:GNAT superfamily N-acetyltransferase